MKIVVKLLTFCLLTLSARLYAQDIHFSQFYLFPHTVNPAFTGNFNGAVRASMIYRNQWFSMPITSTTKGTYQTYAGSVDANLLRDRLGTDKFSVGAVFYGDKAGNGALTTHQFLASIAYRKSVDRNGKSGITLGMQAGFMAKRVFFHDLVFESQLGANGFDKTLYNQESSAIQKPIYYPDFNIGALWQQEATDVISYYGGFSVSHVSAPKESLLGSNNKLDRRYNAQAGLDININDQMKISPSLLYMNQANAQQLNGGFAFQYLFENDIKAFMAARIRSNFKSNDAVIVGLGAEWNSVRASFGYDFTTSSLKTANNGQGAMEVAIQYIFKQEQDKRRRNDQFCPTY